jgi:epsilon-lactone hydrolase
MSAEPIARPPEPLPLVVEHRMGRSLRSRLVTAVLNPLMGRALRSLTGAVFDPALRERLAGFDRVAARFPLPARTRVSPVRVRGLRAEWVRGADVPDPPDAVVLYLHGGGWLVGGLSSHRALAARLSSATGAAALVLDYRMAPDVTLDQEIDDCVAAYRWLLDQGVSARRIVIAGDSAGGHLAVATALRLRDRGHPRPGAVVGLSGVYDLDSAARKAASTPRSDPTGSAAALEWLIDVVLAGDSPADYSPVDAPLGGLPPMLLTVGSPELIRDDAERLGVGLAAAGTACTLQVWEGQPHVFQAFAPVLPEASRSIEEIGGFVRAALDRRLPTELR